MSWAPDIMGLGGVEELDQGADFRQDLWLD